MCRTLSPSLPARCYRFGLARRFPRRITRWAMCFLATLDRPLVVDGFIIAERGSRLEGRVVEAQPAGRGNTTSRSGSSW